MHILYCSNNPTGQSAYSIQAKKHIAWLLEVGYEVTVFSFDTVAYRQELEFELSDGTVKTVQLYPRYVDAWGNDIIQELFKLVKADLIITSYDHFVQSSSWHVLGENHLALAPVDCDPAITLTIDNLQPARWIAGTSLHAKRMIEQSLRAINIYRQVHYLPYSINTETFKPLHKSLKERKRLGRQVLYDKLELAKQGDKFNYEEFMSGIVLSTIGVNNASPARKNYLVALQTASRLQETYKNVYLYIHTDINVAWGGVDVLGLARKFKNLEGRVIFPAPHLYHYRYFDENYVNAVYNASDLYLQPSVGEGFGMPVVEAQSAGTTVIATDATALSEVISEASYLVPTICDVYFDHDRRHFLPSPEFFYVMARTALDAPEDKKEFASELNREFARLFDDKEVRTKHFEPLLRMVEKTFQHSTKTNDLPADTELAFQSVGTHVGTNAVFSVKGNSSHGLVHNERTGDMLINQHSGSFLVKDVDFTPIADFGERSVMGQVLREIEEMYWIDDIVTKQKWVKEYTVVDLGANAGYVSIYFAKALKEHSVKLYAFEPNPETYEKMVQNMAVMGVEAEKYNLGIGEKTETRDLHVSQVSGGDSLYIDTGEKVKVNLLSLEDLCGILPPSINILKVDVEGAEFEAFLSYPEFFERIQVDNIFIELHETDDNQDKIEQLKRLIEKSVNHEKVIVYSKLGEVDK